MTPPRRARVTTLVLAVLVAAIGAASAQGKVIRIGLLEYGSSGPSSDARWQAFRDRLRDLGYVEGKNVVYEIRRAGQVDRLPGLAAELVNLKVDIVVTVTGDAALAAKRASSSIPIVMATGADPVRTGVVTGLARPGGNVTGVISLNADLTGKRMELLKQVAPRVTRIAILRLPENLSSEFTARDAESVAKSLGVAVQRVDATGPKDFDAAFSAMKRARADAVILGVNSPFVAHRRRLVELALSHHLPMMTPAREYADAGALVSYGTDYADQFRAAAMYVDKILKGAKPGDLPIEQPTKFELVVNLKTAKALGLTIPRPVLERADAVIE